MLSKSFSSYLSGYTSLYRSRITSSGCSQSILNFRYIRSVSRFSFLFMIFFYSFLGSSSKSTRSFGLSSSLFFFLASNFSSRFLAFFSKRALISSCIYSSLFLGLDVLFSDLLLEDFSVFGDFETVCIGGAELSPKSKKNPLAAGYSSSFFVSIGIPPPSFFLLLLSLIIDCQVDVATLNTFFFPSSSNFF